MFLRLQLQSGVLAAGQEQFLQFASDEARVNSLQIAVGNMQVFPYELPKPS